MRELCAATALPVNADLENGYADDPRESAAMIARAHECGAAGASIEDASAGRLRAFEAAGADVLYAPGLRTAEQILTVVSAVTRPVNVVMGFADPTLTLERRTRCSARQHRRRARARGAARVPRRSA